MADQDDLLAIVWGETRFLKARETLQVTQDRLSAVVTAMAMEAQKRGLAARMLHWPAPAVGTDDDQPYRDTSAVVEKVATGKWDGSGLPKRAVIWETLESGLPRADSALPESAHWILGQGITAAHFYTAGTGARQRIYGLFEDTAAASEGMPLVSAVSGTGTVRQAATRFNATLAKVIGIAGILLLIVGGLVAEFSGSTLLDARGLLDTRDPQQRSGLVWQTADTCIAHHAQFPTEAPIDFCVKLVTDKYVVPKANAAGTIPWPEGGPAGVITAAKACVAKKPADDLGCAVLWEAALTQAQSGKSSFHRFLAKTSALLTARANDPGTVSILVPMVGIILGITALMVGLGLGTKGRVTGIWIDGRNRVSLARAQVTLWTIVVLSGYAAMAMFNVGVLGRYVMPAGDISISIFPKIPGAIASALGIAATSTMLSGLIKGFKSDATFDVAATSSFATRGATFFGAGTTGLDTKRDPSQASIADLFMGEEDANADTVDVSRLQNVVITITLVLGYLAALVVAVSRIEPGPLFATPSKPYFESLPDLGVAAASLLFVSHATYLVTKAYDNKSDAKPDEVKKPNP
jgi:hypothetical protein